MLYRENILLHRNRTIYTTKHFFDFLYVLQPSAVRRRLRRPKFQNSFITS